MIETYIEIPKKIQAIQVKYNTIDMTEAINFVGQVQGLQLDNPKLFDLLLQSYQHKGKYDGIAITKDDCTLRAKDTDYIVKYEDGNMEVYTQQEFNSKFKKNG